jgi:NAD(P)-dependent dehydrogenase (short-subunit alcohol dehydrogenase family)
MKSNAIITGAGGNLGTAVTKAFLEAEYQVIGTVEEHHSTDEMQKHAALNYIKIDLMKAADSEKLVLEAFKKHGSIDALVLLVGGFGMGNISNSSTDDIQKMVALNFNTAYNMIRPYLAKAKDQSQQGNIIVVGAKPAATLADSGEKLAYALSKAMVMNLAEVINGSTKDTNVKASVVIPSIIDTPANRSSMPDANFSDWVQPSAIAQLMVQICSKEFTPIRDGVYKVYGGV